MSDCLECRRASRCHEESTKLLHDIKEAIKQFNHGHFLQAIEELELVTVRLEKLNNEKSGREI